MENKIISKNKLVYHKDRIKEWKKTGDCAPIYAEIGLINICNHRCIFCGFDQERGRDILRTDVILKNLEDMAKFGLKSICYSGAGEPLLHRDFSLIVRKTKEYNIDVAFSTNTVLFNEKKAEESLPYTTWIRFSIDAATPETHAKIHGTSKKEFPIILKNLADAVEIKRKNKYETTLGVQFILLEENANEIIKAAELFKEIGVDNLQVKPYTLHPTSLNKFTIDYTKYEELERKLNEFSDENFQVISRLKRKEIVEKDKGYAVCYSLPFWTLISEKGDVVPCHIFYSRKEFTYGNIYKNLFSEIWNGERRKEINRRIYERGTKSCGRLGCRGDSINEFLFDLTQGKFTTEDIKLKKGEKLPAHINFI